MSAIPGQTPHGTPMESIDMGETEIPQEVFMEFMDNMRETYTADAYHLLGESEKKKCVRHQLHTSFYQLPRKFLAFTNGNIFLSRMDTGKKI